MKKYKYIRTHWRAGLDEIASNNFLKRYGSEMGLDQSTEVRFMVNGDFENPPMDQTDELYVGCGLGSWANEHYSDEKDKSACCLVARELGLCRKRYGDLVTEVTREDRYGADGVKNHIAQAIKDLYDMGWNYDQIYNWTKTALIAVTDWNSRPDKFSLDTETCARSIEKKFGSETSKRWFSVVQDIKSWDRGEFIKARAYLNRNPDLFLEVETYKGKFKAFIPDQIQGNSRIGAAARSLGAEIVLMQGMLDFEQTGIVLQQKHSAAISFSKVLEELRKHELVTAGGLNSKTVSQCMGEGTIGVCPVWHGHQSASGQFITFAIYNRSKSRPCGPKTQLSWEYIRDVVLDTLTKTPDGEIVKGVQGLLVGGARGLHSVFQK